MNMENVRASIFPSLSPSIHSTQTGIGFLFVHFGYQPYPRPGQYTYIRTRGVYGNVFNECVSEFRCFLLLSN